MSGQPLRLCTKCGLFKDRSEFSKRAASPDGLNNYCKACMSKYYYKESRSSRKAKNILKREKMRAHHLNRKYKMTPEEYDRMYEAQGGKCGICEKQGVPQGMPGEKLVVDHDHETGLVRGLLCYQCNYALVGGVAWLRKAIAYVESRTPKV